MKKTRYILAFASLLIATLPNSLYAEEPVELLAYNASQKDSVNSVDDDILAAMQALDEVGAILDNQADSAETVDIDDIIQAASNDAAPTTPQTQSSAGSSFRIDDVVANTDKQAPAVKETIAAKPETKTETTVAKAQTKSDSPKHNLQTAPANPPKDTIAAKPETTVAKAKTEPVQKHVAPNGVHTTSASQAELPRPELVPASAPQSLPMAYVMAIYQVNGVDLTQASAKKVMPTIAELYQYAFEKKLGYQSTTPAIGDLAFFHNTFDRNRDGRWNDWHTLVGVVESIDANQTITILLYRTDRIERISMNLKYPELDKNKKGKLLNSQLRPNEGAQRGTSSKLFAGFANLLGNATSVTVIDNWKPGMKVK